MPNLIRPRRERGYPSPRYAKKIGEIAHLFASRKTRPITDLINIVFLYRLSSSYNLNLPRHIVFPCQNDFSFLIPILITWSRLLSMVGCKSVSNWESRSPTWICKYIKNAHVNLRPIGFVLMLKPVRCNTHAARKPNSRVYFAPDIRSIANAANLPKI